MIQLTRLNERRFILNAEKIKTIEPTPDTMITLVNGDQFVVRETVEVVVRKAVAYARSIRTFEPR